MAKNKKLKKELKRLRADNAFLMDNLKESGETSGAYFGTVLFLNGDSAAVEAAMLAEMADARKSRENWKEDIEMAVWSVEWYSTLLRLIGKFNECRDLRGQYGEHYALELDLKELCLLQRILDDSGITYWSY